MLIDEKDERCSEESIIMSGCKKRDELWESLHMNKEANSPLTEVEWDMLMKHVEECDICRESFAAFHQLLETHGKEIVEGMIDDWPELRREILSPKCLH
ncbi:MAG: hypothetical protein WC460_01680 [Patescibacteria group bacterium]